MIDPNYLPFILAAEELSYWQSSSITCLSFFGFLPKYQVYVFRWFSFF